MSKGNSRLPCCGDITANCALLPQTFKKLCYTENALSEQSQGNLEMESQLQVDLEQSEETSQGDGTSMGTELKGRSERGNITSQEFAKKRKKKMSRGPGFPLGFRRECLSWGLVNSRRAPKLSAVIRFLHVNGHHSSKVWYRLKSQ